MKLYATLLLTACVTAACNKGYDETMPSTTHTTSATLDDQDRSGVDKGTPLVQGTTQEDLDRTTAVKNALMSSGTLGADAKNIDVITQNGVITLRGQVSTAEEKSFVESTALFAAGGNQVEDQIDVLRPSVLPTK